jgi:hypothetical protein
MSFNIYEEKIFVSSFDPDIKEQILINLFLESGSIRSVFFKKYQKKSNTILFS